MTTAPRSAPAAPVSLLHAPARYCAGPGCRNKLSVLDKTGYCLECVEAPLPPMKYAPLQYKLPLPEKTEPRTAPPGWRWKPGASKELVPDRRKTT